MRILTVNTELNEWAERHDLPVEWDNCPKCGTVREASVPFASKGYRGLVSELHGCGESYRLRVFRPIGDEIKKWNGKAG